MHYRRDVIYLINFRSIISLHFLSKPATAGVDEDIGVADF